jgi:hypothetical protein
MLYFDLFYLELLWSYDPDHEFERLTRVYQYVVVLIFFFKKIFYFKFFLVELYFYQLSRLSLDSLS